MMKTFLCHPLYWKWCRWFLIITQKICEGTRFIPSFYNFSLVDQVINFVFLFFSSQVSKQIVERNHNRAWARNMNEKKNDTLYLHRKFKWKESGVPLNLWADKLNFMIELRKSFTMVNRSRRKSFSQRRHLLLFLFALVLFTMYRDETDRCC